MTWGRLWIVGAVALTGCVIETGYDQDTDPRWTGDDASAENNPDDVLYSASTTLSTVEVPVNILGLPGVLDVGQAGTLTVDGEGAVAVTGSSFGFVGVVNAALGAKVELLVDGDVVRTVVLADALDEVAAPDAAEDDGADSDDVDADTDTPSAGGGAPEIVGGQVQVGAGSLGWVTAPYLAWVVEQGAVSLVEAADVDITLPADAGDTLCAANVDDEGKTSIAVCVGL